MKRLAVVALLVLAGCSGAGNSIATDSFCGHLSDSQAVFGDLQAGTVTDAEAVDRLAGLESDFSDDALVFSDNGQTNEAAAANALATALGHLKVAFSNGSDIQPSLSEVSSAIDSVPSGLCG